MSLASVPRISAFIVLPLILTAELIHPLKAQKATQDAAASPASQQQAPASTPSSTPTFRAMTHLVTVDVVATDKHGQIVPDLLAKDFQVFEQVAGNKGQQEQRISQFEFVTQAAAAAMAKGTPKIPAGVYTNLITMQRLPVPPTILLVDGLNTDIEGGMQARRQMVKMLASIPADTPVAVFLLGNRLQLLQGFTKDPNLLRAAAQKALSLDSASMAAVDARDDPNSLSSLTEEMFGAPGDEAPPQPPMLPSRGSAPAAAPTGPPGGELQLAAIERFEKESMAATVDMRVHITLDALRAIARHLGGYTGRKNLIWISSSFPLTINPDATQQHNLAFEGYRDYSTQVAAVTNALADAKVAVYPVNPLGVQTQAYFDASVRRSTVFGMQPNTLKNTLNRENEARFASQESMQDVAQQTGGKICVNNNDLADCLKTAVTEGSSYYELAYYPDAGDWHGEFHRIAVKTTRPGVQLSFREGYYARAGESVAKSDAQGGGGNDPHLQDAACADLLTSTSILLVAKAYAGDQPGQAKFFMAIDSKMLTLTPSGENREASLDLAVCALDAGGRPLQYMQDHVQQQLSDKEIGAVSISHVIQFSPKPETARVRLVVRDVPSGKVGSVDIPYQAATNIVAAPK